VSDEIISEFSDYLNINSSLIISINGYTDDVGEEEYNQLLSERRAFAVYEKLIKNGVPREKLKYQGFGERSPKNNNEDDAERELNRRTEFYIIKK
jgi:outer membrane protein OmpA-like peptidoglycan-associated protein